MSAVQPLRHNDYLDHMLEAVELIRSYVEGFSKEDFLADKRTQQAVILNIVVIGEAATKLAVEYPVAKVVSFEFPFSHRPPD